jgi:protein O-GlcNAc transferase
MQTNALTRKFQQAIALHQQGRLAQAEALYRQVLQINPRHVDALHSLGLIAAQSGQAQRAVKLFDQAITLNPKLPAPYSNRGNVLLELQQHAAALASFDQALALKPDFADALNNRGNALQKLNRPVEAVASYDRALALNPGYAAALYNRGNALQSLDRYADALASCDRALALRPDYIDAWNGRGLALQCLGRLDEALASFNKALILRPNHFAALMNRGNTLREMGRYHDALTDYATGLAIQPDYHCLLGDWLHTRMKICDWTGIDSGFARLVAGIDVGQHLASPFAALGLPHALSPAQQRRCAEQLVEIKYPAVAAAVNRAPRAPHERIRLGYFSADLYSHATAHLMAGLFEQHDRTQFEVIAFSFGPANFDPVRSRLEAAFDQFHEVHNQSDAAITALSAHLGIDIAIDLKGFTQHGRTGIFARRAAPLQINYLGYPGTMGADYMDYLIADPHLITPDDTAFYSEKIVWLPHSYQVNDASRVIADRQFSRREAGLPEQGFVFCCFNNNWKITAEVFALWMQVLQQVDGSVLWLFEDNAPAAANLRREAQQRGVAAERLVFAPRLPLPEHLARHRLADLFLDTLPYNAHTTASDALWAGLPVLTRRGSTFAGRVGASLLTAVNLPELITHTPDDYLALALELANNAPKRIALRERLAENRLTQPLFDTTRFARHIEAAYREMWQRHQAGLPPDHIVVPA